MTAYAPAAAVELLAFAVLAWEILLGLYLMARLPGPDEFNPIAADRSPSPAEDRRRLRLCAHAFLRAALAGAFLIIA